MNNETDDVKDVQFDDMRVAGEIRVGAFLVYPAGADVTYLRCPLCGSDNDGGYSGNPWGTKSRCYLRPFNLETDMGKDVSLEVERWTTEHLLAGEGVDEVHAKLTAHRGTTTLHSYVERIDALLNDARTADAYKFYLERTGTMDEWVHEQAADAAGSNS